MTTFLPELTLNQIQQGLQQAFPGLMTDLSQLKMLNDGFSSYVILVADEFILRIAKQADAMAGHAREQAVLPLLQNQLPVQIPQPVWRADPSDFFPFGVMGYRRISGIPFSLSLASQVDLSRIAQDVAQFLVALHRIPVAEMFLLGFGETLEMESLSAGVFQTLQTYLTANEYGKIRTWWDGYQSRAVRDRSVPRLIHGDPWGENIILNEALNGVVGVIDFEAVSIGDAAQDFAAQKYLGRDFLRQVIGGYQELGGDLNDHFTIRLQDWSMLRELRGLHYAIKYPDSGELVDSIKKVRFELGMSAY